MDSWGGRDLTNTASEVGVVCDGGRVKEGLKDGEPLQGGCKTRSREYSRGVASVAASCPGGGLGVSTH